MKIAALVLSAIQDLRETKGSTPKKITGYISYASCMPEQRIKRQVSGSEAFIIEISIFSFPTAVITQFLVPITLTCACNVCDFD